jgi:hypothetical protein
MLRIHYDACVIDDKESIVTRRIRVKWNIYRV